MPDANVVGPDTFNQLFTMHGTTMVFFVVMPMLFGFGNYLVPLMIGAGTWLFRGSTRSAIGCSHSVER